MLLGLIIVWFAEWMNIANIVQKLEAEKNCSQHTAITYGLETILKAL